MKVRVTFTVDIDPDAWEAEYGVPRAELREDVNSHIEGSVLAHFDSLGLLNHPEGVTA